MKLNHIINVIDSHTEGEPTRIVVSGLPVLRGDSVREKRDDFKRRYDDLRKTILWEPRGHKDMFGAVLTQPSNRRAQIGAFFIDSSGYLDMCGHGSIGLITACIETGIIPFCGLRKRCLLETPAGLISFVAEFDGEKVGSVAIRNVPSFLFGGDLSLDIPGFGDICADVAYGGIFFLLVEASQFGVAISQNNLETLLGLGRTLREIANKEIEVVHPLLKSKKIDAVQIYESLKNGSGAKNIVIFGGGQFDRSPCGTGTSAKMAALHAKGLLKLNVDYVQESILGTSFKGKLVSETEVKEFSAVIPEITGKAWITGFGQLVVDLDDPFANGYSFSA